MKSNFFTLIGTIVLLPNTTMANTVDWISTAPLPLFFLVLLGIVTLLWLISKKQKSSSPQEIGFQVLNQEEELFIPLDKNEYTLDFLSTLPWNTKFRLSSNLNRVHLTLQEQTYFLEDKNYKNALLVNRRRTHKVKLKEGDILDIGELTLLFQNPLSKKTTNEIAEKDQNTIVPPYADRIKGPIRKGMGILIDEVTKQEFPLTKNIMYLGNSKMNDIVMKEDTIGARHAKIVKIGKQFKFIDLGSPEGSSINYRKAEQRFLRTGDEIAISQYRFRFRIKR